jgi:hypothetical protein
MLTAASYPKPLPMSSFWDAGPIGAFPALDNFQNVLNFFLDEILKKVIDGVT